MAAAAITSPPIPQEYKKMTLQKIRTTFLPDQYFESFPENAGIIRRGRI